MSKHQYTHNYLAMYNEGAHGEADFIDYYTELFEREAAAALEGAAREDVGAVMLYTRDDAEIAYFDYENLVGSVYALGGTRADHMPT
jgi:hypothetical protein